MNNSQINLETVQVFKIVAVQDIARAAAKVQILKNCSTIFLFHGSVNVSTKDNISQ